MWLTVTYPPFLRRSRRLGCGSGTADWVGLARRDRRARLPVSTAANTHTHTAIVDSRLWCSPMTWCCTQHSMRSPCVLAGEARRQHTPTHRCTPLPSS
jgi:hypothetical protein